MAGECAIVGDEEMTPASFAVHRLRLSGRERRGLIWVRTWARTRLTAAKRRLKYSPRKTVFDPEEAATLQALVQLETAVQRLLAEEEDK